MDDLVSLLERRYAFLQRQEGVKVVRQARLFAQFILGDPRLSAIITDLVRETERAFQDLDIFDERLLPALIECREELAKQAPECDDSKVQRPDPPNVSTIRYERTLAFFDAYATGAERPSGIPLEPRPNDDNSKFNKLIGILIGKAHGLIDGIDPRTGALDTSKERDDVLPLHKRLRALEELHDHQFRTTLDLKYSHAGPAWLTLQTTLAELNPVPVDESALSDAERTHRLARAFHGQGVLLNKALYGLSPLSSDEQQQLRQVVAFIRDLCDQVFEELMLRIGLRRSHLALINRYRLRCEWHEQTVLRKLVEGSDTPEDDLARHLALWLFDQGLNPLTKLRAGNLEPDLFDPMMVVSLYVEAKQYENADGTRHYLKKGVWQMFDTMGRLSSQPYAVTEGYYVIYRRGGPRYVLPEVIKHGPFTIYPVLVDIAVASDSGSRQKHKPIIVTDEELVDSNTNE